MSVGAAKKTQRIKEETTNRWSNKYERRFTWRDQDEEGNYSAKNGKVTDKYEEAPREKSDKFVGMSNCPIGNKKHKRSSSLGDRPCLDDNANFSITAMVAEADERDFRAPKMRRATSKPSLHESSGPLLSSTIDLEESQDEEIEQEELDILRGGKNKSESLKESFKKRVPAGQSNDVNRNRTDAARKGRRGDKFDEQRNLHEGNTSSAPQQDNNESVTPNEHFTTPTGEEMEANMSFNSPIISSSRRGKLLANWADASIASDFTIQSEGKAGGPRRRTRRGKKKKRNQSASISDTSLTSSFRDTLRGRADESFDMEGSQPQQFSGSFRINTDSGGQASSKLQTSDGVMLTQNQLTPLTSGNNGTRPKNSLVLAARRTLALQSGVGSVNSATSTPATDGYRRRQDECPILSRISEMVKAGNPYEGDGGGLDLDDSRVIDCEMGCSVQKSKRDHLPQLDQSQEIDLNMLLPNSCKKFGNNRRFKARGMIQFVIMRRTEGSGEEWEFFPRKSLENLINAIEGRNASSGNGLSGAFKFANMWGVVPLLGLYSSDMGLLTGYRHQVELFNDGFEYQTFPREALDRRLALTVMLWQNLEGIQDDAIAPNLLDRNPGLDGGVKVARLKIFRSEDLDTRGESMLGARLAQLDGNDTFLKSLAKFPRSHRFGLGVGTVIIRGGDRAPEPEGSTWGRQKMQKKPTTYSEAARSGNNPDLNISLNSLNAYTQQASGVMREAERSIRGSGQPRPKR